MAAIAILGDYDSQNANHRCTEQALRHSAAALGQEIATAWYATDALLEPATQDELARSSAVLCTTGSPYRSFEGALRGIRLAREGGIPFLGTCGGFQHAVIEYARNVAGMAGTEHAEYGDGSEHALIAALECSLAGKTFEVELRGGSRVAACYGRARALERYYCSYGINPRRLRELLERGLPIVGTADDGTPRILELTEHPFFVATLFVPQASSTAASPHPIVTGFVRAAMQARRELD